jgi:hypothetical protein
MKTDISVCSEGGKETDIVCCRSFDNSGMFSWTKPEDCPNKGKVYYSECKKGYCETSYGDPSNISNPCNPRGDSSECGYNTCKKGQCIRENGAAPEGHISCDITDPNSCGYSVCEKGYCVFKEGTKPAGVKSCDGLDSKCGFYGCAIGGDNSRMCIRMEGVPTNQVLCDPNYKSTGPNDLFDVCTNLSPGAGTVCGDDGLCKIEQGYSGNDCTANSACGSYLACEGKACVKKSGKMPEGEVTCSVESSESADCFTPIYMGCDFSGKEPVCKAMEGTAPGHTECDPSNPGSCNNNPVSEGDHPECDPADPESCKVIRACVNNLCESFTKLNPPPEGATSCKSGRDCRPSYCTDEGYCVNPYNSEGAEGKKPCTDKIECGHYGCNKDGYCTWKPGVRDILGGDDCQNSSGNPDDSLCKRYHVCNSAGFCVGQSDKPGPEQKTCTEGEHSDCGYAVCEGMQCVNKPGSAPANAITCGGGPLDYNCFKFECVNGVWMVSPGPINFIAFLTQIMMYQLHEKEGQACDCSIYCGDYRKVCDDGYCKRREGRDLMLGEIACEGNHTCGFNRCDNGMCYRIGRQPLPGEKSNCFATDKKCNPVTGENMTEGEVDDTSGADISPKASIDYSKMISQNKPERETAPNVVKEITVYHDMSCGMCKWAYKNAIKELLAKDVRDGKLKIVFKEFPLLGGEDMDKAIQAKCSAEQGKYNEFIDAVYLAEKGAKIDYKLLGIDEDKLKTCAFREDIKIAVNADKAEGEKLGVPGTPTFFINGEKYPGAKTADELRSIIYGQ